MEILLFGGTAEGRALAGWLSEHGVSTTLCVATEYGAELIPAGGPIAVCTGRLDRGGMESLMASRQFSCCVDATHPYAVEVSCNVSAACATAGLLYYRLIRQRTDGTAGQLRVPDAAAAADLLERIPGNILLTTGSKELEVYARPGLRERCFPRVLPNRDSLDRCLALGFPAKQIICMQGPFSMALNLAMLEQWSVTALVTKDTGEVGGFSEKTQAASLRGCALVVIDRPSHEVGYTLEEIKALLEKGEV